MYRRLCTKLGVNYAWGVFNYFLGVCCGAFVAGLIAGVIQ